MYYFLLRLTFYVACCTALCIPTVTWLCL